MNKEKKEIKRYNVYYTKYNIFANDYVPYIRVVETDDIFHYVGKMFYQTLEKIGCIRWTEPKASREECEKMWIAEGYSKLDASGNFFVKEDFTKKEKHISEESAFYVRDFAKYLIDQRKFSSFADFDFLVDCVSDYLDGKKI